LRKSSILAFVLAAIAVSTALAAKPGGVWLDVPYIHQEKDGCGSASLAMLLQYWQAKNATFPAGRSDPMQIQRELLSPKANGIYASAMVSYLNDSGFAAYTFRGAWTDLREHLAKGRPLIVSLKPAHSSDLHYVVVVGIDWENGAIFLNDPARTKLLRLDRDTFLNDWRAAGFWTLLAVPRPAHPVT
jgi:predicted double-glycine peptidase